MKPGKFGQNLLGALNGVSFCNQSSEHGIFRSKANSALSEVPKVAFFTTFVIGGTQSFTIEGASQGRIGLD